MRVGENGRAEKRRKRKKKTRESEESSVVNMSDVEWDAEGFEPPTTAQKEASEKSQAPLVSDKWEGEDEEDEIKDNWDDEDEGGAEKTEQSEAVVAKRKKKKLADIIAQKEAKQLEEIERRKKEKEEQALNDTPEEKLKEKLRIQQIQKDADLQIASELMGSTVSNENEEEDKMLDEIDLSYNEGLSSFRKALISKIRRTDRLEKRPFYVIFVEELCRDLCQNLDVDEVKRVSSVINSVYNEKVKASKPKNKKKGGKAKLNLGQGTIADDMSNDYRGFEYDDFI